MGKIITSRLPDKLHTGSRDGRKISEHTLVQSTRSQATAYQEHRFQPRQQTEVGQSLFAAFGILQQTLTDRVSRQDDFLFREKTLHSVVSHTNLIGPLGQQLIGHSGIRILLLYQCGDSHRLGHIQRGTAGIASYSHGRHRPEITDNLPRHPAAFPNLEKHGNILQQMLAVETANRQCLDRITGSRNTLHLHPPFGSDEQYLGFRMLRFDGIRNGHGREYMSARSSSAHDNP